MKEKQTHRRQGEGEGWIGSFGLADTSHYIG